MTIKGISSSASRKRGLNRLASSFSGKRFWVLALQSSLLSELLKRGNQTSGDTPHSLLTEDVV
ncbi:MAG: hypothetical protein QXP38_09125 [Nitrososphaerota archaeon]